MKEDIYTIRQIEKKAMDEKLYLYKNINKVITHRFKIKIL